MNHAFLDQKRRQIARDAMLKRLAPLPTDPSKSDLKRMLAEAAANTASIGNATSRREQTTPRKSP